MAIAVTGTAGTRRRARRLLLATAIVTITVAGSAWAHGDPASHYLETDALYPSYASQPSVENQLKLLGLLQESERRGYPIKVALVAGAEDLVDDLAMLRTPQRYAETVAATIERKLEAPVLVVTPFGLGVSGNLGRLRPAALVRGIAVPRAADGDELARTAMTAVRRIARAGGHPLPARVAPAEQYVAPATALAAPPVTGLVDEEPAGGSSALLTAVPAALVALAFLVGYLRSRRRGEGPTVAPAPEIG